jgi:hypothetical protein
MRGGLAIRQINFAGCFCEMPSLISNVPTMASDTDALQSEGFLAFFWAEVIIALSLLAVVLAWLIRGPGGDNQK